jgi:NADH:ubiquinone oxidoreductase subunit 2 (subunit N)
MSTGVKAAAFAAFVRVFLSAFEPLRSSWGTVLWPVAALTMIVGTVVGVAQTNIKRMLAYSSIAHGGYLLLALISGNDLGKGAVLFYLLTYAVTNNAFGVIVLGSRSAERRSRLRRSRHDHRAGRAVTIFPPSLAASADGRLHREVGSVRRRDQGRLRLAGDHRCPDERRVVSTPPRRRHDT